MVLWLLALLLSPHQALAIESSLPLGFCSDLATRTAIVTHKFTSEQKKALLLAAAAEVDCPVISPNALHSINPWGGTLSECEALQLSERFLYESFFKIEKQSLLSRYRLTSDSIFRTLIYSALSKVYAQKILNLLKERKFIEKPGRIEKAKLALFHNPIPMQLAHLSLYGWLFYYLGVPPEALLALPVLAVSGGGILSYFKVPQEAVDAAVSGKMDLAVLITKEKFRVMKLDFSKLDIALIGVNRLYTTAAKVGLIYLLVKLVPWIQFAYSSALITHASMQEYEQAHSDPVKVVDEELQGWLESLDKKPTIEAISKKRKELEEMEKLGVFRVYIKDP